MTKINSFVVPGAISFAAAKFVFERSTKTAVIAGLIVGFIGLAITSVNIPQPQQPL